MYVNFSSIAMELNVLSSIAIEITFVTLEHGFKKAGSVLYDILRLGQGLFKSDYINRYLHTWVVLRLCIVFTVGEKSTCLLQIWSLILPFIEATFPRAKFLCHI